MAKSSENQQISQEETRIIELIKAAREKSENDIKDCSVAHEAYKAAATAVKNNLIATDNAMRLYEEAIILYACQLFICGKDSKALDDLISDSLVSFHNVPKAKTAKCIRLLIDALSSHLYMPLTFSKVSNSNTNNNKEAVHAVISVCDRYRAWCKEQTRTFLLYRINLKLIHIYMYNEQNIAKAQELIKDMITDVKKLDDKLLLIEIFLYESICLYYVNNIPKARASLTAARTNANAVHCPPSLQGLIDIHAGILHAHEKDYNTSYSYFFEAFEAFSALEATQHAQKQREMNSLYGLPKTHAPESKALLSLKYMLMSKILSGKDKDVHSLLTNSSGLKYYQQELHENSKPIDTADTMAMDISERDMKEMAKVDSMVFNNVCPVLEMLRLLSISNQERSIFKYKYIIQKYKSYIDQDNVLAHHIDVLYNKLLEENIKKILLPYKRIEVSYLSHLIRIPKNVLILKLSEMILDKKIHATLDEGIDVLILFDHVPVPSLYEDTLKTIQNLGGVVDSLYQKAQLAI